jgi:polyketide biosynthesis enoyl-CoA hydratase PksH
MKEFIDGCHNALSTLNVENSNDGLIKIIFNDTSNNNAISSVMIEELSGVLESIKGDESIKIIIFQSLLPIFSRGMDFQEIIKANDSSIVITQSGSYYELLKTLTTIDKVVISMIDGRVNAGGIGFVAVSDLVISTSKSIFSLSEALFDLVPACVLPFLIQKIGFHKAKWMSLSTQPISAQKALEINLVDEIVENLDDSLRIQKLRLLKVKSKTTGRIKLYMHYLTDFEENSKSKALNCLQNIIEDQNVIENIRFFQEKGIGPWER